MAMFIIVPSGVVNSYRKRSADGFHELDPIKLYERNAYALPVAVLDRPEFADLTPSLNGMAQEELTVEDFEWYWTQGPLASSGPGGGKGQGNNA